MRAVVLALACGISFVLYLHRYVWGFVKKDVQTEFGWDPVTLGWLDSLFPASYAAGQIPSGILCDWFGAHLLLGFSILLWSLALAGMALAIGYMSMAAARLALGATQAGCYPVLNKVSKNWFPVAQRTSAQGLIATFFGRAGGAASFFLFGTVLVGWLALPWRWAVGVFALLGIGCGALFLLLFRNTPREHPWANEAEAELVTVGDAEAAFSAGSRLRWTALLRSLTIWFLFLRALASNLADVLFVYWVPLYLRDAKQMAAADAGWMSALPLVGGALGGLVSSRIQSAMIHRTSSRRWARRAAGMIGKSLAALLMLSSLTIENAAALAIVFLVVKFFTDWEQPAEWGAVTDVAGRNAATVFACVNTIGALGGFVAGPLNGFVLRWFDTGDHLSPAGWNALFIIVAIEYMVAAASWLFIDCEKPLELPSKEVP